MSVKHPIIAITGSSGAGTTSVTRTFQHIFRREKLDAAIIEGDSFHRYDRTAMKAAMAEAAQSGNNHFSHFGANSNLFEELEALFASYGESGGGRSRKYLHNEAEAAPYKQQPGTFTPWEELRRGTDLLFYEGLHQRVPVILGSKDEVERIARYHGEHDRGVDQPYTSPLFNTRSLFVQQ